MLRGAEGECRSSQAKGSGDDDTPKSAAAAARRRCNLPETAGNLSGNGRRHEAKGPCVSDCQKTCQAKSFGGKKSVKGNRQGVLSRLITPGELSPAISTETRTFKGKILIDNDQLKLRPGMFAKADIIVDRADSSIIIPKDVILSNRRRKYVYIVEKNTAKIRNLQTGLEDEYNIEILSGLNVNDNLVVKGFETLKEDAKVKIQK